MELRLAFTEFVFAFCAVVMADRIHGFSERMLTALGLRRSRQPAKADLVTAGANDWYVHFYRSELTGALRPRTPGAVRTPSRTTAPTAARPRRDTRPRLQA
jgi:hypothetical protein